MELENVTSWIEHLNKPLVLVGFSLFVLVGLIKLFKYEKLTSKATAHLIGKGMMLTFVLGFLIVIFAFADSSMHQQATMPQPKSIQEIKNVQGSTAAIGGQDATVLQGNGVLQQQNNESFPFIPPTNTEQRIDGVTDGVTAVGGRYSTVKTQIEEK